MTVETIISKRFEPFYFGFCRCGCGKDMKLTTWDGYLRYYIHGHNRPFGKGDKNIKWKGGRIKIHNYWYLWMPEYPRTNNDGYIMEHVYFYEQYHQCCMLKWAVIHHIEPVTEDYCNNMPWNLVGMMRGDHSRFHNSDRYGNQDTICFDCLLPNTYRDKYGYERWYNYQHVFLCSRCYRKRKY